MNLWIGSTPGARQVSAPTGQLNCGYASFGVSATKSPEAEQPDLKVCSSISVEQAMGAVVLQLVLGLRILNLTIGRLETELAEQLDRHADTAILRSLPGVGIVLAGRMLSEFGDDPTRFKDAASRRDYAGTAPITKASGRGRVVLMRRVRNTRLFDTCRDWSFSAVNASRAPGRSTSSDVGSATATRRHSAGWRTSWSASLIIACGTASPIGKRPLGR